MEYTVVIIPTRIRTRALVSHGPDELLRALRPAPSQVRPARSTIRFLEGLSRGIDARLRVVLCVDVREAGFCLGLTPRPISSVDCRYYEVEVRDRGVRRRREQRIRGIGDVADPPVVAHLVARPRRGVA